MKYITATITPLNSPYLSSKNTGLGNCLFQVASIYGISKKLNIECTFPNIKEYCNKLQNLYGYDHYKTILRNIYNIDNNSIIYNEMYNNCHLNRTYDINLLNYITNINHNLIVEGYLENPNYFHEYHNDIQNMFSIDDSSEVFIKNKYGHIFNSNNKIISVHFRCGYDYLHHYTPMINFYKNAINYFKKKYENVHFLLFSDNINFIQLDEYEFNNNFTVIENNIDYMDLWIMSKCDGYIISPSTFSWWGVYLNKKNEIDVLYDKEYESKYTIDYSFITNYIGI